MKIKQGILHFFGFFLQQQQQQQLQQTQQIGHAGIANIPTNKKINIGRKCIA